MTSTFLRAVLLGFSVAAPVGPIGILCIRRTLSDGRVVGLACGLGAATADALYGLVAGLGLTAVSAAMVGHQRPIRLVGCAYLLVLGVRTFRAAPAEQAGETRPGRAWAAWGSTFVLTLTNPLTIASFAAMFSAIGLSGEAFPLGWAPLLAGGAFLGSAAWWLLLSASVDRLRSRVRAQHLGWINRAAGAALVGFAAWALASVVGA